MREVISNTSPLQYLFQAELLDLLPALYGTVVVPSGVADELAEAVHWAWPFLIRERFHGCVFA